MAAYKLPLIICKRTRRLLSNLEIDFGKKFNWTFKFAMHCLERGDTSNCNEESKILFSLLLLNLFKNHIRRRRPLLQMSEIRPLTPSSETPWTIIVIQKGSNMALSSEEAKMLFRAFSSSSLLAFAAIREGFIIHHNATLCMQKTY